MVCSSSWFSVSYDQNGIWQIITRIWHNNSLRDPSILLSCFQSHFKAAGWRVTWSWGPTGRHAAISTIWEDGVTAILGWGQIGENLMDIFGMCQGYLIDPLTEVSSRISVSNKRSQPQQLNVSPRSALGFAREMTTMEGSRERSWTTSLRVLAKPTTWSSTGCRFFEGPWTLCNLCIGRTLKTWGLDSERGVEMKRGAKQRWKRRGRKQEKVVWRGTRGGDWGRRRLPHLPPPLAPSRSWKKSRRRRSCQGEENRRKGAKTRRRQGERKTGNGAWRGDKGRMILGRRLQKAKVLGLGSYCRRCWPAHVARSVLLSCTLTFIFIFSNTRGLVRQLAQQVTSCARNVAKRWVAQCTMYINLLYLSQL